MTAIDAGAMPKESFMQGKRQYILPAAGVIFTVLLILVPFCTLVLFSFRSGTLIDPGPFTLNNYMRAYGDPQTYRMFLNTVVMAIFGTMISVGMAVFFAFLTERTDMPMRNVAWALMLIPMAVPGLLFAMSWTFLLSPRIGLFNVWIRDFFSLFGFDMGVEGPFNVYTLTGMIFLEGIRGVTTTFLIIVGAFRTMDPNLEEAARTSGATNRVTFFKIFLPILTPAILAASMYNFMSHLESLEVPLVVGLPAQIYTFPSFIYFSTQRFSPPQYGTSAALGATFILVSIIMVWWYRRIVGKAGKYATITGKGYRPRIIHLGKWRYPCFSLFVLYFVLTIAAPTAILLWTSFLSTYIPPSMPGVWDRLSWTNYKEVFEDPDIWQASVNTLWLAVGAATVTMLLSLLMAWVTIRGRMRGRGLLDTITFLPHALPGVIIGIAFIFLFLQPPLANLQLYGSLWIVILGLTVSYISFGSRTMNGALAQISGEMEEAGKTSGAKWLSILRHIVLPLLMPAFISGWVWVASHALRNFSIPVMLTGRDNMVLSVIMFQNWDDGYPGRTAAVGIILILVLTIFTVGGRFLVTRLSRQQG